MQFMLNLRNLLSETNWHRDETQGSLEEVIIAL